MNKNTKLKLKTSTGLHSIERGLRLRVTQISQNLMTIVISKFIYRWSYYTLNSKIFTVCLRSTEHKHVTHSVRHGLVPTSRPWNEVFKPTCRLSFVTSYLRLHRWVRLLKMDSQEQDIRVRMEREFKNTDEPMFYLAGLKPAEKERIPRFHTSENGFHQAWGHLYKEIEANSNYVCKVLRQFDKPQAYQEFLVGCNMVEGDCTAGSVRQISNLNIDLLGKFICTRCVILPWCLNFLCKFQIFCLQNFLVHSLNMHIECSNILTVVFSYTIIVDESKNLYSVIKGYMIGDS